MLDIVLEAALRATLIAAAALFALWSLRVRAAAVRHGVCTVVMLAMLALPLAIAFAPDVSLRVYSQAPSAVAPASYSIDVRPTPIEAAAGAAEPTRASSWNWQAWLLAVYCAGAAVLLARLAIGTVRVRSLAHQATLVNGVLTSTRIATPFTFGLLKPRILLPAGWERWSATRLAIVLDHEHAHIARRDPLVQWLALLNRAVFWFHPLAWWLERRLAALAEEACDAAVLARGHSPADYSEQLLDVARLAAGRPTPHLVHAPMPGSALPARIAKILDGGIGLPASRTAVAGAAALATLAAAVLGTVTLAQEAVPPRNLLEVYELALANDPAVRQAEAARRQDLLIRVAEPYFDVLAAERTLALQASAREAFSRQLEHAQRRFEVGLISITDVQELQGVFDLAVANGLAAQDALAAAQEALRAIVGEPVGQLRPLVEDLPLSVPDLERVARRTEPEVRAAYLGVISEISRVRALEQSVQSNENAFKATRAGFDAGTRTSVDVVVAQSNLRQAETAYAGSRDSYALNVLRFQRAAGGVTPPELEDLTSWFE
jgi:beta-lactamase regulating signal transducer with metallopeptidase domain